MPTAGAGGRRGGGWSPRGGTSCAVWRLAGGAGERLAADEVRVSDVVIVGSGVAGLAAALGCAGRAVTVLTKTRLGAGGSSAWAQGGVAAAVGEDDSPALHAADTLAVAGGLADPAVVGLLTREGPARVAELVRLGAAFDREGSGAGPRLALGREAAHSRRRILHAGGDATGAELVRALVAAVLAAPGVRVEEESFAIDLALAPVPASSSRRSRRVAGVLALDRAGRRVLHLAGATVLATGGAGQLYLHTTNPPEVTADGLAMAARAGARLADLEFVQFHPTALAAGGGTGKLPLLTEALRGEGAVLVDGRGHRFMPDEHPDAELAPRDVVARAIHRRLAAGDRVFLDARAAVGDRFPERFPTVWAAARAAGLDPRREPLPVVPAAHYHMGGVVTDARGRTSLPGLWACGETAATGVHGANRLASNSLLEGLVFGARVAGDVARRLPVGEDAVARAEELRGAGWARDRRRVVESGGTVAARGSARTDRLVKERSEADGWGGAAPGPALASAVADGAQEGPAAARPSPGAERFESASAAEPALSANRERSAAAGGRRRAAVSLRDAAEYVRRRLRERMWADVGLVRDADGMARAADELRRLEAEVDALLRRAEALPGAAAPGGALRRLLETRNLVTAGRLVAAAADVRRESRGAHHRLDHPHEEPAWRRRLLVTARPGAAPLLALSAPIGEPAPAAGTAAAKTAGSAHVAPDALAAASRRPAESPSLAEALR